MGIITPTFTLKSNASSATSNAGPMSVALSLSATDSLDVTEVASKIVEISDTHQTIWAHDDYFTTNADFGVDGGFLYFKNLLTENSPADLQHDIMIGNAAEDLDGQDEFNRLFTLQPGEFAWMPWDFTFDITADGGGISPSETNAAALECWLFVRTTTV